MNVSLVPQEALAPVVGRLAGQPTAPEDVRPRQPRYLSLDLWRGVACLFVVVYHATLIHAAYGLSSNAGRATDHVATWLLELTYCLSIGVPMFFVISGYCIAAAADAARRRRHSVRSYFVRRFRRIYPPFWILIACFLVFHVVVDYLLFPGILSLSPAPALRPWWYSGWQWLGSLTLTETWRPYVIGGPRGHYPGHSWTLCYEEQFYAVTGLLLLVTARRFFLGAALVSGLTVAALVGSAWWRVPIEGFFFDGSWLTFAAGVLVYYSVNYASPRGRWFLLAVLLAAVVWSIVDPERVPGGWAAFPFAVLLLALHRWDSHLATAPLVRPLMYCGTMCYSLYLIHMLPVKALSHGLHRMGVNGDWPTLLITVPLCVAVSLVLGRLFYLLVEQHFLNTRPEPSSPPGS
jgi:peptidoglycan/LPS O-acetylase OafA/YrhL